MNLIKHLFRLMFIHAMESHLIIVFVFFLDSVALLKSVQKCTQTNHTNKQLCISKESDEY